MRDADKLFEATIDVLKVFLLIQPTQEYVRSIVAQLLTLIYWKDQSDVLPFWNLFSSSPSSFNEEPIEVSFSLLGRAMANDSKRTDRAHVEKKYRGVRRYMDTKKDFVSDCLDKDTMKTNSGRFEVKQASPKLVIVKNWVLDMINKARFNTYRPYNDKKAFKSIIKASEYLVNPLSRTSCAPRTYNPDAASILVEQKDRLVAELENTWATSVFSEHYVHMKPEEQERAEFRRRGAGEARAAARPRARPHVVPQAVERAAEDTDDDEEDEELPELEENEGSDEDPLPQSAMNARHSHMEKMKGRMAEHTDRHKNKLAEKGESAVVKAAFEKRVKEYERKTGKELKGSKYYALYDEVQVECALQSVQSGRQAKRKCVSKLKHNEEEVDEELLEAMANSAVELEEN